MNNLEAKLQLSKPLFRGVAVIHAIAFRKTKNFQSANSDKQIMNLRLL